MKMIAWISLIIISSFAVGDARNTNKIVGGRRIDIKNAPYYASIRYAAHDLCGASIISTSHLLTSASCTLADTEPIAVLGNLQVVTGLNNRFATSSYIHDISLVIFHFHYSPRDFWRDDIALLKLKSPIVESSIRSRVFFPIGRFRFGLRVVIVSLNNLTSASDSCLHFIELKVISLSICRNIFKYFSSSSITHTCARTLYLDEAISKGDGGNGIVNSHDKNRKIVGVVSVQIPIKKEIIRFTRIREYIPWIERTTRSM